MYPYHSDKFTLFYSEDDHRAKISQEKLNNLERLDQWIDFTYFQATVEKALGITKSRVKSALMKGGRPRYNAVLMIKILFLQQMYNLSDDQMEYQIKDRISFQSFLGLRMESRIPDAKTIWAFRNDLEKAGCFKELFDSMVQTLESQGVIANQGQIVDASFVETPRQRNNKSQNETIKAGEIPQEWKDKPNKLRQKDTDARWTMKRKVAHYGYKDHIRVDVGSKLITAFSVTDAAVHDSQEATNLASQMLTVKEQDFFADSAYISKKLLEEYKNLGYLPQVNERAYRNAPLTRWQKESNKKKSKVRARVEHVFGKIENSFGGMQARARSYSRIHAVVALKNMVYNLTRLTELRVPLVPDKI